MSDMTFLLILSFLSILSFFLDKMAQKACKAKRTQKFYWICVGKKTRQIYFLRRPNSDEVQKRNYARC